MVELEGATDDVRIRRIRVVCSISMPTCPSTRGNTHTHTQIYIYCFSTATMIRERALMLRYTYIACLVFVLCYVGSGMCDDVITLSEMS